MIDVVSAVMGAGVILVTGAVLYASYLKGRIDAKAPESVVDLDKVRGYLTQDAAIDALRDRSEDNDA